MAYSWSEHKVFMGGRFVTGIRGFKYKSTRKVENIYAEGDEVADVGYGNREYSCEMKLLQNELEAIIQAGGGDPFSLKPFTVVHSYIPTHGVAQVVTDIIEGVEFTDVEKAMDQGATFMEITCPMNCRKIKYNQTGVNL